MSGRLRAATAIVGVGESAYTRRGQAAAPDLALAVEAIVNACASASIAPSSIDGFATFGAEPISPLDLAVALGLDELHSSTMQAGGGGGGCAAAVANAAAAIHAGLARRVVVYRCIVQRADSRFSQGGYAGATAPELVHARTHGVVAPAHRYALRVRRLLAELGGGESACRAIALASHHHAQRNPRAVRWGRPLTAALYDADRFVAEPIRRFDCCLETDGAAAVVLTAADEAADRCDRPAYVLAAVAGAGRRGTIALENQPRLASAGFETVVSRLYADAGLGPAEIDVVQAYENFTGGVVMALIEHGLCAPERVDADLTVERLLAPHGELPLNTSGGNLAEAYVQGMNLIVEGARQLAGTSPNQVPDAQVSLVVGGPMTPLGSSLLLGSAATR